MSDGTITLVTGGNRGIGLEVCRQLAAMGHTVLLGARDLGKGERAAAALAVQGLTVQPLALDVTDPASMAAAYEQVKAEHGRLDVLINNAAILIDADRRAIDLDMTTVQQTFITNVMGPWQMVQIFLPLLRRSAHPRVVNVSSEMGTIAEMSGADPSYSLSKAALNALNKLLAEDLRRDRILVNAICPGWVATDMGGPHAGPVTAGARRVIWAALLPDDGPTGTFTRDGETLPY